MILTSAKKTFFAGGDLNHLLAAKAEDAAALFERAQGMKAQEFLDANNAYGFFAPLSDL